MKKKNKILTFGSCASNKPKLSKINKHKTFKEKQIVCPNCLCDYNGQKCHKCGFCHSCAG